MFESELVNWLVLSAALAVCTLRAWPAPAQASPQDQQPIVTFQSKSELVLVPVVVTDSKGRRVADLSVNDFTILENSKPHNVTSFERIHAESAPPALPVESGLYTNASTAGTQLPSITIVLLDSLNTSALDQKNAIEQISKMLSSPFPGPVAVWQLVPKGIVVVQDFTSDQKQLAVAAQRFKTARSAEDLLNTTAVAGQRPYNFLAVDRDYSGTVNTYIDVDTEQRSNELALQDAARQTLDTMLRVAKALRQIEGRKSLFWATGGLSSSVEDQIGNELAAANVSVYPIEVTNTKGPGDSPAYFNNRVRYRKSEANGLRRVAEQTGGVYCAHAADAANCLADAVADASDYYMLAFSIDTRNMSPGPHPIEVRVQRAAVQVRARSAYFVEGGSKDKGRGAAEIASAMDTPLNYTNLPFAVRWLGRNDANSRVNLSFRLLVPRGVLETNHQNDAGFDLSVAATALEKEGKTAGTFSKDFAGKLSTETAAQLAEKGFFWDGAIQVNPSAEIVRFVIRDNLTGRLGSISVPITAR